MKLITQQTRYGILNCSTFLCVPYIPTSIRFYYMDRESVCRLLWQVFYYILVVAVIVVVNSFRVCSITLCYGKLFITNSYLWNINISFLSIRFWRL